MGATTTTMAFLAAAALGLTGCAGDDEPAAPPTPETTEVSPIDDEQALADAGLEPGVAWIEPGVEIAVFLPGSGSGDCNPVPTGATAMDATTIEVALAEPESDGPCTMDLRQWGWRVTVAGDVDADAEVSVTLGDDPAVLSIEPDDVVDVP